MISDIITTHGGFFTRAVSKVTPSYPSVFKWPRQQHNITNAHKSLFCQILAANIDNRHRKLTQLLGAQTTIQTIFRKYRKSGEVVCSGNAQGQWAIPQLRRLCSSKVKCSLNGELNANEYCANKQQGLKPPQGQLLAYFVLRLKINDPTNNQTNIMHVIGADVFSSLIAHWLIYLIWRDNFIII